MRTAGPGTYSNKTGLRRTEDCLECTPGYFCDGYGLTSPRGPCDPGYYCLAKSYTSAPHAPGSTLAQLSDTSSIGGLCPSGGEFDDHTAACHVIRRILPSRIQRTPRLSRHSVVWDGQKNSHYINATPRQVLRENITTIQARQVPAIAKTVIRVNLKLLRPCAFRAHRFLLFWFEQSAPIWRMSCESLCMPCAVCLSCHLFDQAEAKASQFTICNTPELGPLKVNLVSVRISCVFSCNSTLQSRLLLRARPEKHQRECGDADRKHELPF